MINKKIEEKFPNLKDKIFLYREAKRNANISKYLFKISKDENDKKICFQYLNNENKLLLEIKKDILNILRKSPIANRNVFQYWLNRNERKIAI